MRLAAAGRHEHIAAGQDRLDDLGLAGAKRRNAEHGAQQTFCGGEIGLGRQVHRYRVTIWPAVWIMLTIWLS